MSVAEWAAPIAGPIIGGILGGEYNKNAQESAQRFSAEQARASADEARAARKEAPDDALNYFNKVAPDSSQSERLGVSGSAVGSVVSQPMQSAIARGTQKVAAQKMTNDIQIQKAQLMQNAATDAGNAANQARISKLNNKTTLSAAMLQNGTPVNQVGKESDKILNSDESGSRDGLPKVIQDIKTSSASEKRMKLQSLIDSGKLRVEEERLAKDIMLTGKWQSLSKFISMVNGNLKPTHTGDMTSRYKQRDKKVKELTR